MTMILFDDPETRINLLPLTFTRPVAALRIGIDTIAEKWESFLGLKAAFQTETYLQAKFPASSGDDLYVEGALLPNASLAEALLALKEGEVLIAGGRRLAWRGTPQKEIPWNQPFQRISNLWDLFMLNDTVLRADFNRLTKGRQSAPLSSTNTLIGEAQNLFIEEGAVVEASVLNVRSGPIYIGKGAEIMEGCLIRGPVAIGEGTQVKMGAKIYGASTFGPQVRVGGEVNNSIMLGYCNKAHDGFLGHSVIGEWCNLGADSNNSNLKNNYATVKLYHYGKRAFINTGLQFCGLFMGDHSKCGINTMFNTGTVVGVSANIFGSGFPRNFIPSFSWGGAQGFQTYRLEEALATARRVMERRHIPFTEADEVIFAEVFARDAFKS
ncbi:MAG: GlmU family protein [Flavobacteriales bacterium]|nr:GlmU family protein [Flavobacteriales bacterium]MCX7767407.1 GlmU family protein [Flavobacteriales bacterium]MDW8410177.1 GlmU family protein [Flavobacteriales bacterium]